MRLDKDKQIDELADFQQEMLNQKDLSNIALGHLRSQGLPKDKLNTGKEETEEK